MSNNSAKQRIAFLLFCFLPGSLAFSQTVSLSLSSGSAVEGGSVALNLSLSSSGGAPAGLQWKLSFASSDVSSVSLAAGTVLTSASKTLSCNPVAGSVTCVTFGMNEATIANGVAATVTVTLAPATSGPTVPISVTAISASSADGSPETVSATSGAVTVLNWQPALSSLQCSPTSLTSGASSTCTVTLAAAAPSGGTVVSLASNSTLLPVAASVTVAAGSTSASFKATAGTVSSNQTATITATLNGVSKTASISLTAAAGISTLSCNPTALGQNSSSTCTVTLSQAAPGGGATVTLASNASALTVPASVTVAASSTTATFTAKSGTFSTSQTATITATYSGTSATATISLSSTPYVASLSCSPTTLTSGASTTCTVTASNILSSRLQILLSSNNSLLTVPTLVNIIRGLLTAKFTATAGSIASNQTATITASLNGSSKTATLTLSTTQSSKAQIRLTGLTCTPATLPAQSNGLCTATLGNVASSAGARLRLSSSSASLMLPAAVAGRPGQSTVQFQVTSAASAQEETAVVSAALNTDTLQQTVSLLSAHRLQVVVPASQAAQFGSPLRFAVSASDPTATLTAGPLPPGAAFDAATGVFLWTPSAAQRGAYHVAFTAANSAGETGTAHSTIYVDAGDPIVERILNAASGDAQRACGPGAIARIEGRWLTQGDSASDPSGASLELAGTSVLVDGTPASILDASPARIDFLCPDAVPTARLQILVRTAQSVSQPVETVQTAAAPGIFTVDGSAAGQGLVFIDGQSKLAMVPNYLSDSAPAQPGDRIVILTTGIDAASGVWVRIGDTGVAAASVAPVPGHPGVSQVAAFVPDGVPAGASLPLSIEVRAADGSSVRSNSVSVATEAK